MLSIQELLNQFKNLPNSFQALLNRMLSRVSDKRDKRQGSIIHDTLAPVAAELAQQNININIYKLQSYLKTMTGENIDNWAENFMLFRYPATHAIRIGEFMDNENQLFNPPIGSRFSTVNSISNINYIVTERYSEGQALLQCETVGTSGNDYSGKILPLTIINNLKTANIIGTYRPAQNTETDDSFSQRIIDWLTKKPFGGNQQSYKEWVMGIDGVGAVKIYSVWQGGGTVKISILDGDLNPATEEFIELVQSIIDPIMNQGEGLGQAPIGHKVTVSTPLEVTIDITATVVLKSGFVIEQIETHVNESLTDYLQALKEEWAVSDALWIFIARISMAILSINGVENVHSIRINGQAVDFELPQDKFMQRIPRLGVVAVNA